LRTKIDLAGEVQDGSSGLGLEPAPALDRLQRQIDIERMIVGNPDASGNTGRRCRWMAAAEPVDHQDRMATSRQLVGRRQAEDAGAHYHDIV
jgi:hypothetical protein